jgi:hypothetical protein
MTPQYLKLTGLVVAAFLAQAGTAMARDQPGADWISMEQAMQKATAAGYTNVTGLKADDGRWEGKGVKNGKIMKFHLDPRTGAVTREKIDD